LGYDVASVLCDSRVESPLVDLLVFAGLEIHK
jgi:hypothetical protein